MLKWWALHCGEIKLLVGSFVSGEELLCHCSVAKVDSESKPVAGGEDYPCAMLLWTPQKEPLQSTVRTDSDQV